VHHPRVTTETTGTPGVALRTATPSASSRLRPFPFHPILLAAYPVLFLFSENLSEVAFGETFQPILRAVSVAGVIAIGAGLLLRDLRRGALIASSVVIVWFTYGHVEDLVAPLGFTRDVQLGLSVAFIAAVSLGAIFLRPSAIARLTSAVNIVSVVLVVMTLVSIVPYQLGRGTGTAAAATDQVRPAAPPGARDIYFLVFDRYGNTDSMRDFAGIDNDLPAWLEAKGFDVAADAHANYGRTTQSLAATLNMTYLDDVAAQLGRDSSEAALVNEMIQDHAVGRFLQDHGYRYVHIGSWFAPTKTVRIADENPVLTSSTDFGALLDSTTMGPTMNDLLGIKDPPAHHLLHRAAGLFDLNELDRVSREAGPKFVLMHVLLPHEPYVFAANGEYSGLSEADSKFSAAGLRDQLTFTNDRIRGIVDGLLSGPEETRPIIIIAGDEGPYPDRYARDQNGFDWATATDAELETKYGVLNALYLPGEAPAGTPAVYSDMTLINTFPIVLDRYFDADIPLLPDRSYTSAKWVRPWDLTDITDRLE
jgi:hypothetical protein